MKRTLLTTFAVVLTLGGFAAWPAAAGSTRIEWLNTNPQGGPPGDQVLEPSAVTGFAEEIVTSTGAAAQSGAAPSFRNGTGYARITARTAAVIVAVSGPASIANGWAVSQGQTRLIPVAAGARLSLLEDPTAASTPSVSCVNCATASAQTTGNGSLATIATNTTGAATAANQTTAISSLSTIATNQTVVQATAGSDASKALAVQGVTGGKSLAVKIDQTSSGSNNTVVMGVTAVGVSAVQLTDTATSAVASSVSKGAPSNVYSWHGVAGASAGFFQVFNATSAPADGAVTPLECYPVAANGGVVVSNGPIAVNFSTGFTLVFSTTGCFTKTASATAFMSYRAK